MFKIYVTLYTYWYITIDSMALIKLSGYKCERCSHQWMPRNSERPMVCPKCKSPYWNKPRKNRCTI